MVTTQETFAMDYYGSGIGTDIDPLDLKMLNIGLDRVNPDSEPTTDFTSGSLFDITDFLGIGYLLPTLNSIQTTASVSDIAPVDAPNDYEDTDYQDVTYTTTSQTAPPVTSANAHTDCNCSKAGDKPDSLSAEYWKSWMAQQARSSRVWGTAILVLFIYLAYRAGKNG